MSTKIIFLSSVAIISIILAGVFFGMYLHCNSSNKDNFCGTCQGMDIKTCPDKPLLHQLYDDGKLTESSDLKRSKEWPKLPKWPLDGGNNRVCSSCSS